MTENIENISWYFAFRQTSPCPPGQWIACGPYDSYEKALEERSRAKAWDCEVSVPYSAVSKEVAEVMARRQQNVTVISRRSDWPRLTG